MIVRQFLLLSFIFAFSGSVIAQSSDLHRSAPSKEKVSEKQLKKFYKAIDRSGLDFHSIQILRNGKVVSEKWWDGYSPSENHIQYSCSKTFTSVAIGLAKEEGLLSLDDKVISYFPDELPEDLQSDFEKLTIEHLLTMTTGQKKNPPRKGDTWISDFFNTPIEKEPGSYFKYNSSATFLLSAIIQKVSGEKLIDYLQSRLFQPLGIQNIYWEEGPHGINAGGWGLYLKTEDMAKFGQLFLQNGVWNGQQLLPKAWVEKSSSKQIDSYPIGKPDMAGDEHSDWTQGYGYQMWLGRHNTYYAFGAKGQFIIVIPNKNAVVAVTANIPEEQEVLNLIWKYLLPTMK